MNYFSTTVKYENDNMLTKMNVQANGKEEAIDKVMETIFKKDFHRYMKIEKVEVIDYGPMS